MFCLFLPLKFRQFHHDASLINVDTVDGIKIMHSLEEMKKKIMTTIDKHGIDLMGVLPFYRAFRGPHKTREVV